MARKMRENFKKKKPITSARQQSVTIIYINRARRQVPIGIYATNSQASKDNNDHPPQKDTAR